MISHEQTGLLCPPGNATALANALIIVLKDPGGARARAVAAAEDVRKRFDQDALTERIWRVYEELVC